MSNRTSVFSVLLPLGAMEICKLYAAASAFFMLPGLTPFPFLPSVTALFAAIGVSRLLRMVSIRRITALLLHVAGFTVTAGMVLNRYAGLPFGGAESTGQWLQVFTSIQGLNDWFIFTLVVIWTAVFWLRGRNIGSGKISCHRTVGRFDMGLLVFLYIYILQLGIGVSGPFEVRLVISYLLFGVISLFAARNLNTDRQFIGSRSVFSTLFLFASGFMTTGVVLILLYPILSQTAAEVYSVLKTAAEPAAPWIIALLRFIFGFGFGRGAAGGSTGSSVSEAPLTAPAEPGPLARIFGYILMYGLIAILGILILIIIGYAVWRLYRFLSSHTSSSTSQPTLKEFLAALFFRLRKILFHITNRLQWIFRSLAADQNRPKGVGAAYFRKLTVWGRRSGIPKRGDETASEYGGRIAIRFPEVGSDVRRIVEALELEFYGNRHLSRDIVTGLYRANKALRSLRLLPFRILNRLRISPFGPNRHRPD